MSKTLAKLLNELFVILDRVETTDNGTVFHPVCISSCRVMETEKLNKLLPALKRVTLLEINKED